MTTDSKKTPIKVKCPTCEKSVAWVETSTFRPFCSERCQQVDLGAWATEAYAIPAEPTEEWSSEHNSSVGENQSYTLQ